MAAAQVGNGNVYDRGGDASGTRNWVVEALPGLTAGFTFDDVLIVGQETQIAVTITNNTGRALPDITGWDGHVEFGVKGKDANNLVDKPLPGNEQLVLGYDAYDNAIMNQSLSDGQSFTFYIAVDTSVAGTLTFDFDVWSRLDNKNWRVLLLCVEGLEIVVIEDDPQYDAPDDDEEGLVIPVALLGDVLPQTNGQDWLKIWLDEQEIFGNGNNGNNPNWTKSCYNTNSQNIIIKPGAFAGAGPDTDFVTIYAYSIPKNEWFEFTLELIYVDGVLKGANLVPPTVDEE